MEVVAHKVFLGCHVAEIVVVGLDFDGDVFHDVETVALKANTFYGIVGHESHVGDAEAAEYLSADAVIAFVGFVAQQYIGFDGIMTLLLEFVCLYLIHKTYATTLLIEIYDSTATLFFNHFESFMELIAAIASF